MNVELRMLSYRQSRWRIIKCWISLAILRNS